MTDQIAIKDVAQQVAVLSGKVDTLTSGAMLPTKNREDIIRLQEAVKFISTEVTGIKTLVSNMSTEVKSWQKTNQRVIISYSVIALVSSIIGPYILSRIFA